MAVGLTLQELLESPRSGCPGNKDPDSESERASLQNKGGGESNSDSIPEQDGESGLKRGIRGEK